MVQQSRTKSNNLTLAAGVFFALTFLLPQGVYSQEGASVPGQINETPVVTEAAPEKTEKRGFWGKRSKKNKDKAAPEVNSPAAETLAPEANPAVLETTAAPEVLSETPAEAAAVIEDLTTAETADIAEEITAVVEETAAAAIEEVAPMAEIQDALPAETLAQDVPPAVEETVNALEEAAATNIAEAVQAVEVQNEIPAAAETVAEIAAEPAAETFVQEMPAVEETIAEIIPAPEVQPVVEDKNKLALEKIDDVTKANQKEMQLIAKDFRLRMNAAKTEAERLVLKEEYKIEQTRKTAEHQQALDELKASLE